MSSAFLFGENCTEIVSKRGCLMTLNLEGMRVAIKIARLLSLKATPLIFNRTKEAIEGACGTID